MAQLQKLLSLLIVSVLLNNCATHREYISPCLTNSDNDYKDIVTIVGQAECFSKSAFINEPVTEAIKQVGVANVQPIVAVYKFQDLTGQRKSIDGYASFSTAMTQAPETYLIRALKQSGFFRVVERGGIDHITRERQIEMTKEKTKYRLDWYKLTAWILVISFCIAPCKAIDLLSFIALPVSNSTSFVPSAIYLNKSLDKPTDKIVLVVKFSNKTSPVLTETILIATMTVSSRYCLELPIPKYLAPTPPVAKLVL